MYSFTANAKLPSIIAVCDCKRQFLIEEMYACFNCSYSFCRHCSIEEIQSCFCQNCLTNILPSIDILGVPECTRCLECPLCINHLIPLALSNPTEREKVMIYYHCTNCFWDSKSIGITATNTEDLFALVRSKVKEGVDPKKTEYNNLVSSYKEEFAKMDTLNAQFVKLKKKSSSYRSTMSLLRKRDTVRKKYWTVSDAEKAAIEQDNRIFSSMTILGLEDKNTLPLKEPPKEKAIDISNPIFEDFYNEAFPSLDADMEKIDSQINMEQRMRYPTVYDPDLQKLYPLPVKLFPRRSRKCKKCMKNVVRSQNGSTVSSDFKILTLLGENFPKLTIKKLNNFYLNKECEIIMNFYNKTRNVLHLEITPLESEQAKALGLVDSKLITKNKFSIKSPMMLGEDPEVMLSKQNFVEEVIFRANIVGDSDSITQFGFSLKCIIQIDIDKIVLELPILIKLGNPQVNV